MENTCVQINQFGGPDVLEVIEEPIRKLTQGEIRVKVLAAGVALGDVMRRVGKFPSALSLPLTLGYDGVGIVEELGEGTNGFVIGDKVAYFFGGTGGYASYVYAKEDELVVISPKIEPEMGAAIILNYVIAYQMLHRVAKVTEGESILIHGASGGVGTALLDLGRRAKLKMYGTASKMKHDVVSSFGAVPIDYQNQDFVEILQREVPEGIDVVFDPIGGTNYKRSQNILSEKGRFVGFGYTSILKEGNAQDWARDWDELTSKGETENGNKTYLYTISGFKKDHLDWFQEDLKYLFSLLEKEEIKPIIFGRFPLSEVAKAHELIETSNKVGKIILYT
ncbi:medium chain dehydrogenase/reductase family protein [Shimazuella sp. AN120528]|uniref:medium chain dehydrogenase/reductase family protein n=1 Tax=Shimazuella soli TaxID=1892854 RepID=UPI001F0D9261|nr:medium chain dehydrogenase/reductase family protein [Shimazuella soli]MCH5585239.1 medium chain dehydrogenase/reductase family protein [Shimazuella soli]